MKKTLDIIAMGIAAMDYYLFLDTFTPGAEKIWAGSAAFLPGGTMGNFISAAAGVGLKTGFYGVVGRDVFGQLLKRDFQQRGIDCSHLIFRRQGVTPVPVILQDKAQNRTIFIPPFMQIQSEEVDPTYLRQAQVLHTHLFDREICLNCARILKESRGVFSLDLELHRVREMNASQLQELLALTGVLFLNAETLQGLEPGSDLGRAAGNLKSRGPKVVVVTLGEQGSLAVTARGKIVRAPAAPARVVDATGAGDCFAGTFFYGYLKGWPMVKILSYASAASAAVVEQFGARAGQPSQEAFLRRGKIFYQQVRACL